jgi:enamine deaminase RidA (YjgF/YER057c/UK114 family)
MEAVAHAKDTSNRMLSDPQGDINLSHGIRDPGLSERNGGSKSRNDRSAITRWRMRSSAAGTSVKAGLAVVLLAASPAFSADTHSPPNDFANALAGETRQLEFHVADPSSSGTLEHQIRAALEDLFSKSPRAVILKLRVFAIGPEDLATARLTIRNAFTTARRPLPVLSLVGVAALPEHGQRVVVESVTLGKRALNPFGLELLAGFASPRAEQTIDGLARVALESGVLMQDVMRVSCFYQSPEQADAARLAIAATFPAVESSFVLSIVSESKPTIECEAVARLNAPSSEDVRYFNLPGTEASPYFSRATRVSASKLIFTGTEMALGDSQQDAREPFERLKSAVERLGGKLADIVMSDNYWLTIAARDRNREVRGDFLGQTVPAASGVFFASLASSRATQAIEFVVALPDAVTVNVGSSTVDGRALYKSHLASFCE